MTRRGARSWDAIVRRNAAWRIHHDKVIDGRVKGSYRWERRHGDGATVLFAICESCGWVRVDVHPQECNLRHPDGRLLAEALMFAVATYGSCGHCGANSVRLVPFCDERAWFEPYMSRADERESRLAFS